MCVFCNSDGTVLAMLPRNSGCMKFNEMEVAPILEALRIFTFSFHSKLVFGKLLEECHLLDIFLKFLCFLYFINFLRVKGAKI